jgi:hypothetical protein
VNIGVPSGIGIAAITDLDREIFAALAQRAQLEPPAEHARHAGCEVRARPLRCCSRSAGG